MTDWRREARAALFGYAKAKRRGEDTSAVDLALAMQDRYYNAAARRRMVDLVYIRRTHTLAGAAVDAGYSIETVKKWNVELLAAVGAGLQKRPGA